MRALRFNLVGFVIMTMAFFWGCFGAAGAWRFSLEIQFLFFGALVVCW